MSTFISTAYYKVKFISSALEKPETRFICSLVSTSCLRNTGVSWVPISLAWLATLEFFSRQFSPRWFSDRRTTNNFFEKSIFMLNTFHFYLHITFGFIVYESVEWSVGSKPDLLERAVLREDPLQVLLATIFIDIWNEKRWLVRSSPASSSLRPPPDL